MTTDTTQPNAGAEAAAFAGRLSLRATCRLWNPQSVCAVVAVTPSGYKLTNPEKPDWSATMPGGDLTISPDYCTGQYWPTEYRKAVASVLEAAANLARQSRPPRVALPSTISELKALNRENGSHWFDRDTMRFFGTRIESGVLHGRFFISSEQNPSGSRRFTVRSFDEKGDIDTVGEFHAHRSRKEATDALRAHLSSTQVAA